MYKIICICIILIHKYITSPSYVCQYILLAFLLLFFHKLGYRSATIYISDPWKENGRWERGGSTISGTTCRRGSRGSHSSAGYLWLYTAIAARCFFAPRFLPRFSPFPPLLFVSFFSSASRRTARHYREYRP